MRSRDEQKIGLALSALSKFKEHKLELVKKIVACLDSRNSISVRRAACVTLGSVNNALVAPYLVKQLGDKALVSFAVDALQRLTGQSFGNDPGAWMKWLEANKDFKPVNTDLDTYLAEKQKKEDAKRAKANAENADSAEFYGVEIEGKNILFVLDRSGSMSSKTEYGTRLDQLKKEFSDMVDALNSEMSLGVLWFPGNQTYPAKGISKLSDTFKKSLKKHMVRIKEGGGTPIGEAMTYVFENIVEKRNIDAIYLLSDGAPSTPPEQVRQLIKDLNGGYYIKIHTISIGHDSEFMKNVASDNFGSYTAIK